MKSEVYSWRVSADLKAALEAEARHRNMSVSGLLDKIAREWIKGHQKERLDDETEQRRLHAEVAKFAGALSIGRGPYTNERVRKIIGEHLARKYGRKLPR
jgi:hypothetical protein